MHLVRMCIQPQQDRFRRCLYFCLPPRLETVHTTRVSYIPPRVRARHATTAFPPLPTHHSPQSDRSVAFLQNASHRAWPSSPLNSSIIAFNCTTRGGDDVSKWLAIAASMRVSLSDTVHEHKGRVKEEGACYDVTSEWAEDTGTAWVDSFLAARWGHPAERVERELQRRTKC